MLRNVRELTLPKARAAIVASRRCLALRVAGSLNRGTAERRDMASYRHPHLIRAIVHTPHGAFAVVRGLVDLPDEVGERLGWAPVKELSSPTELSDRSLPISSVAPAPGDPR
jgi:hypothetical protein